MKNIPYHPHHYPCSLCTLSTYSLLIHCLLAMHITGNPNLDKQLTAIEIDADNGYAKMPLSYYTTLHEHGRVWNARETFCLANVGRLDLLKYAHKHGCPWHDQTTSIAAWYGRLDCLRYACENGCPWNDGTSRDGTIRNAVMNAVMNNQVECLQYIHQNGGVLNENIFYQAIIHGSMKCVEYMHERGLSKMFNRRTTKYICSKSYEYLYTHGLIDISES